MPSNNILINNSLEYTVPDRKMDELVEWLKANGFLADTRVKGNPTPEQPMGKYIRALSY